jgi:hypothetical protein
LTVPRVVGVLFDTVCIHSSADEYSVGFCAVFDLVDHDSTDSASAPLKFGEEVQESEFGF